MFLCIGCAKGVDDDDYYVTKIIVGEVVVSHMPKCVMCSSSVLFCSDQVMFTLYALCFFYFPALINKRL